MYKRKRGINALDLLKEMNEYRKPNQSDIYDIKTLNIKDYENQKRLYNTKTIKTCITSYMDNDSINKEIKKKKNIGKLDLCSHRNKDIFFEVDSEQYDSGNNSKESFNYRKNNCSKLLINKITPYISEHYLTQNNINPYYNIKTYNSYNIKKPFNNNKKKNNLKKRKIKEDIENEVIPYKIHKNKNSNSLSFNSSNDKIKYPFVISLKCKNNNNIQKNSNLSNYFNEEMNDYFDSLTENSNYFEENEEKINNKNNYNYPYNNNMNYKGKNSFELNKNEKEPDYKRLYLMKKKQFDNLLQEFNDMHNKLNASKYNYMINNFKKLNKNKINNKIKNNITNNKKEFKRDIEIIHNIDIFYEKIQKISPLNNLNNEAINNTIPINKTNSVLKILKEIQFEIIKTLKNKINFIPININQIKLNPDKNSNNSNKNGFIFCKINNIQLISEVQYFRSRKNSRENNFVINKINNFKILSNNMTFKSNKNKINSNSNFKIDNNININLNQKNNNFSWILNHKYFISKFNFQIIPEAITKISNGICDMNVLGNNKKNLVNNKKKVTTNNISINLSDILAEMNSGNLKKLKKNLIFNKESGNNKVETKEKRDIVECNINRILNKNKERNKKSDIIPNNNNIVQNYPKEELNFLKEEIMDLPEFSDIRNKLRISIIKKSKINESELNDI